MSSFSDFLKNYELAEPTIRGLYDSKLRLAILDALKEGPMRLADLRRVVNANAPNTSTKAKDLENLGIIERVDGDFQLTPYGMAVRQRAQESFEFYATYQKFRKFWDGNITTGIPDFLWARLGDLNNSVVVETTSKDVTKVHDSFVELLNSIHGKFYGVSPIFHEDYLKAAIMLVKKGIETQLIVNKEILQECVKVPKTVKTFDNSPNCKFFVIKGDITTAFTVTDDFLSMGLRSKHIPDSYMHADFQSTDPRAIKWGLDLFEYYKKQAKLVKLSDYL